MQADAMTSLRILTVCTANICRSPAAARMLATRLPTTEVSSAGVRALIGEPMDPRTLDALRVRNINPGPFQATALTKQRIMNADLILTAEISHRDAALRLAPAALKRTFTLVEFAQLAPGVPPAVDAASFIRAVSAARGGSADLDIADPVSMGGEGYLRVMDQIDRAVEASARALRPYL